jgi:hypothetical protein
MALFTVQVILTSASGLPRDNCVNVYHFTGTGGDADALAQAMVKAYEPVTDSGSAIIAGINRVSAKVYDGLGLAPNPPLATFAGPPITVAGVGPREIALCLSTRGSPALSGRPPGLLPQERGRTFIGPIGTQHIGVERPSAFLRGKVLDVGSAIAAINTSQPGFLWVAGSARVEVSEIYVDNEWDTQRRRGLRPTARDTRSV